MSDDLPDLPYIKEQLDDDWIASCGLCNSTFAISYAVSPTNPAPHGLFCPDCRSRKHKAPGVLNWHRRVEVENV